MNILVLCTGNSARSILGEVLFNMLAQGKVRAFSAGSQPTGKVNPAALCLLEHKGHDTDGLSSKSWDVFSATGAPEMDIVITVCASAAGETCPVWPGAPVRVHWGFPDPAAETDEALKKAAFEQVYAGLSANITRFLAVFKPDMPHAALRDALVQAHVPLKEGA